ncbi:hypothetical protein NQ314_002149 [Rhamnusium bicolor]|uniref:MADF domain-containing protein n=1 Tax=Rhamnusium bicolor TaxID=1586634 RepID=A0AAV8ZQE9_9CUCU|nr:hypothetical protein NQ314_002149 [Rhamnusium bicolor]
MSHKVKKFCRFNREMDEKLIELVSKNEVLYNTGHKLYKDLAVRDDVWLAISTVVGRNVNECKTRWRSLRDLYHRKRKDEKKGKKTRCQWEYMEMLSFLDNFTTERKLETNQEESSEEKEENHTNKSIEHFAPNYMNLIALPFNINDSQMSNFKRPGSEDGATIGNKRLKSDFNEEEIKEEAESIQLLREIRDATQAKQHPIKMFFDSMANTVMSFPPALAAEAKLKVCQIVTELECRMLDESGLVDVDADINY